MEMEMSAPLLKCRYSATGDISDVDDQLTHVLWETW